MRGITFILFGNVECQMLSEFLFVCFTLFVSVIYICCCSCVNFVRMP